MEKLEYELLSVSPLAAAGADGRTVEVRPTEIKALLRFWWRALHPDLTSARLYEEESKIFGGTGSKSRFNLRVTEPIEEKSVQISLTPHKVQRDQRGLVTAKYYCFLLFITTNDSQIKKMLESLVVISFLLGALGKRSRRGFGSFIVIDEPLFDELNFETLKKHFNIINSNLNWEIKEDGLVLAQKVNSRKDLPFLTEIKLVKSDTEETGNMLSNIGNLTHNYSGFRKNYAERHASPVYVTIYEHKDGELGYLVSKLNYNSEKLKSDVVNKFYEGLKHG